MDIIEQYRILHERGHWFKGTAIKGYVSEIDQVIQDTGAKTLLDYGCGKAIFYRERKIHEEWGVPMPFLYDPGVREFSKKPVGKFDGVICTDVLEHVEKPEEVIQELYGFAEKFLFCTISCRPSNENKKLLDGRGLHISIFPPEWWRARFPSRDGLRVELRFDVEE